MFATNVEPLVFSRPSTGAIESSPWDGSGEWADPLPPEDLGQAPVFQNPDGDVLEFDTPSSACCESCAAGGECEGGCGGSCSGDCGGSCSVGAPSLGTPGRGGMQEGRHGGGSGGEVCCDGSPLSTGCWCDPENQAVPQSPPGSDPCCPSSYEYCCDGSDPSDGCYCDDGSLQAPSGSDPCCDDTYEEYCCDGVTPLSEGCWCDDDKLVPQNPPGSSECCPDYEEGDCCCCPYELDVVLIDEKGKKHKLGPVKPWYKAPPKRAIRVMPIIQNKIEIHLTMAFYGNKIPVKPCKFELWEKASEGDPANRGKKAGSKAFKGSPSKWEDKVDKDGKSASSQARLARFERELEAHLRDSKKAKKPDRKFRGTVTPWLAHLIEMKHAEECPFEESVAMKDTPFSDEAKFLEFEYRLTGSCSDCDPMQIAVEGTQWLVPPGAGGGKLPPKGDIRFGKPTRPKPIRTGAPSRK